MDSISTLEHVLGFIQLSQPILRHCNRRSMLSASYDFELQGFQILPFGTGVVASEVELQSFVVEAGSFEGLCCLRKMLVAFCLSVG
jgi:hypothetical protein